MLMVIEWIVQLNPPTRSPGALWFWWCIRYHAGWRLGILQMATLTYLDRRFLGVDGANLEPLEATFWWPQLFPGQLPTSIHIGTPLLDTPWHMIYGCGWKMDKWGIYPNRHEHDPNLRIVFEKSIISHWILGYRVHYFQENPHDCSIPGTKASSAVDHFPRSTIDDQQKQMHPEIYAEILGLHGCPRDAFSAWGTGVCVWMMQLQYNEALWYIVASTIITYTYYRYIDAYIYQTLWIQTLSQKVLNPLVIIPQTLPRKVRLDP